MNDGIITSALTQTISFQAGKQNIEVLNLACCTIHSTKLSIYSIRSYTLQVYSFNQTAI